MCHHVKHLERKENCQLLKEKSCPMVKVSKATKSLLSICMFGIKRFIVNCFSLLTSSWMSVLVRGCEQFHHGPNCCIGWDPEQKKL